MIGSKTTDVISLSSISYAFTVAVVYSEPGCVTFTDVTFPFVMTASAVAPMPSPKITSLGALVRPEPPIVTLISEIPVDESGTSSKKKFLVVPSASKPV